MRLVLSSLFALGLFSNLAFAAPRSRCASLISVIVVSSTASAVKLIFFNPQKAGSGLIVDTLAAQLYDRLLDAI
ncbi:hypothetical protein HR12_16030, partial [Microbacterium sp. SUBG005]